MTAPNDNANRREHARPNQAKLGHPPPACRPIPTVPADQTSLTPGELVLLAGFVDRVRAASVPNTLKRITLFGSRARGQWHADSDLDIAVFVTSGAANDRDRQRLAHQLAEIADQAQTGWEDLPLLRPILIATDQPINRTLLAAIEADGIQLWP
ncbi:MAG: nucleotidyltransferase domain-containing protein [Thiohalocapsa sp.]